MGRLVAPIASGRQAAAASPGRIVISFRRGGLVQSERAVAGDER
ncbi:hypothetical protein LA76x_0943 [Lysobacter antibioticus]|uniref:Uncharacterized protein n=1 Tax=Lysobacter antibioticus TaxID=84531 RepID=A0A0S2F6G0_LYSAN|nr:hypothetical protein LA76x_0943 [Lysobacter antibioticus]